MKTNIISIIAITLALGLGLTSCSKDENLWGTNEFVAAFKNPSESMDGHKSAIDVEIVFSDISAGEGWVDVSIQAGDLTYGEGGDFTTIPEAKDGIIRIPIHKNTNSTFLQIKRLTGNLPADNRPVEFSIIHIEMPDKASCIQGNTSVLVSFDEAASLGGTITPQVGGPNEPNQIYLELRTKTETAIRRDAWDLGFYSGDEFRVKLNSSLYMFAGKLSSTDISNISNTEVKALKSKMGFLIDGSENYVDDPSGALHGYVIEEISENDNENHVYLLKMGYEIGSDSPDAGSVAISGKDRGYKKVRILRKGNDYLLQYADLNETDYHEIVIPKTAGYNFTFFSLTNGNLASVEPESGRWDLNFTVKTEVEPLPGAGYTAYGYSDYVETNFLGGVQAYRVSTDQYSYEKFSSGDIDASQFNSDQRTIGASWRKVTPPDKFMYDNIFYIIKDSANNYYKLRFTALENENGVRGYPQFKYDLLK